MNTEIKGAALVTPEVHGFLVVITSGHHVLRPCDLVGEFDRSEHGKHCPASWEQREGRSLPLLCGSCAQAIQRHRSPYPQVYC
jgi:hypothetical protein